MKILALYLPQFHVIPENDAWWGTGYTEWTAVRNAKPLYKNHNQPRIPLNDNYYDLSDPDAMTWKWQANLAKKYGIYGFCIYHYWFESKQLLQKPMEILLQHPEININYCICWANETWSRNWYAQEKTVLLEQTYGDEAAWERHYRYLNQFFKDERYIKINNRPIIHIYHSQEIVNLPAMIRLWNALAKKDGFDGVYIISGITAKGIDNRKDVIDAWYMFNPGFVLKKGLKKSEYVQYVLQTGLKRYCNKLLKTHFCEHIIDARLIYKHIEDDEIPAGAFPCTFPQWDNTPRTGIAGLSYQNTTPQRFERHLQKLIEKYKDKVFLYINAWNEWGEGAYLEPDKKYNYEYLEAIKKAFVS